MSSSDEFTEDLHSHTFRSKPNQSVSARGRRPYITSGPTLSGSAHWQRDEKEANAPPTAANSFTQQYQQLQQQQDALGNISQARLQQQQQAQAQQAERARRGKGVWSEGGNTILMGRNAKKAVAKQSKIAATYHTQGTKAATSAHSKPLPSLAAASSSSGLPPVAGAAPPSSQTYHGLSWQSPAAFPSAIPLTARPPNLMAWVKSISKLDANHPEQRGYYVTGDMMPQQPDQPYLSIEELQEKYAAQYAQLASQQQAQQYASTFPTPDQFQSFYLAQQAEQAAQQKAAMERADQQAAIARAAASQPADNPTLSLTWGPNATPGKPQPPNQTLGTTASQSNLNRPPSQSQFIPQPPPVPPPSSTLNQQLSHASSSASLHGRNTAAESSNSTQPQSTLANSTSSSNFLSSSSSTSHLAHPHSQGANGEIILKAKGLTQRRQAELESKENERLTLEMEEKRSQIEAKELRDYQAEQQKQREEKERLIVLKQSKLSKKKGGLSSSSFQSTDSFDMNSSSQGGFEFLVPPASSQKKGLHQTLLKKNDSVNAIPVPPIHSLLSTASQPSLYVHASTSQPLLPNAFSSSHSIDWTHMASTASLPTPQGRGGSFFNSNSTASLSSNPQSTALSTSYEDVRLNSSRISVDLDVTLPNSTASNNGNKILLNISGKELPHDKNLLVVVYRKNETATAANPSDLSSGDASSWDYIGCTELINSTSTPNWERSFILDGKISQLLDPSRSLIPMNDQGSNANDLQLLSVTKKKHRLFSGTGTVTDDIPTILKVQVLHLLQPHELKHNLNGALSQNDTHLFFSSTPPSTLASTTTALPQAEAIGEVYFLLDQVKDQTNNQEFKLKPVPLTPAQLLQLKRKQMELGRLVSQNPSLTHLAPNANSSTTLVPGPPANVPGSLFIQAKTIGIIVPIDLSLSCSNLPVSEWMHKCDPVVVVYASNPNTGLFSWVGQTPRFRSTPSPIFQEKVTVFSYSHCDRMLRFAVYDSELVGGMSNHSSAYGPPLNIKYKERDLLGEIFVSLDELVTSGQDSSSLDQPDSSASSSSNALSFRLLKRKQVVRVAGEESSIKVQAQMRPILLANAPNNQPQQPPQQSYVPNQSTIEDTSSSDLSTALTTTDQYSTNPIVVGGSLNLRSSPSSQALVPKGYAPHFYDPDHPNETMYGATRTAADANAYPGANDDNSMLVQLSIACAGLPKSSQTNKCDPIVVLYAAEKSSNDPNAMPTWRILSQSERFINSGEPIFHRLLQVRLPRNQSVQDGGDLRIAVYDSQETDHIRYHTDPSQSLPVGTPEYFIQESRLLGEHFFNLRLLVAYAQQEQDRKGTHEMHLDLVKHGRIVLRRKGAPIRASSTGENLNANGAAQFILQILNISDLPRLSNEPQVQQSLALQPAGPDAGKLIAQATNPVTPASALGSSTNLQASGIESTPTSQLAVSISCRGLLKKNFNNLTPIAANPLCVIYISNPTQNNTFEFFSQTERRSSDNSPAWQKVFLLDKEIVRGEHRPWLQHLTNKDEDDDQSTANAALLNSTLELKFCVFDVDADDLFQHGDLLGQAVLPLSSLLFQSRQDLRLSDPATGEVVGHSVLTVQSADVGQVIKGFLTIAANGLPKNDWSSKCDPVGAIYTHNPFIQQYTYTGQTERIRTTTTPIFKRLIPIDLYAEQDRPLRVAVYDTDADEMCTESNLLGECYCSLKQLQAQADLYRATMKTYEQSLILAQARDGKHGGMVLPKRPEISSGLFIKLTNNHVIDVQAKKLMTASATVGAQPLSAVSYQPSNSATQTSEIFISLVYNKDEYASALESGLMRQSIFQKKIDKDRINFADFERVNDSRNPSMDMQLRLRPTSNMLVAGQTVQGLSSSSSQQHLIPMPTHTIDPLSASSGVTEEVWQTVWSFTSSAKCQLFSHLPNGITVTSQDLSGLLDAAKNLSGLMWHLKRLNEAKRKFSSLKEIIPAIHLAIASNTHVSQDVWSDIVKWLTSKECKLFSDSKSVQHSGLNVTIQSLDRAIVASHGVDELLKHLKRYNLVHRKFETFEDLLPAITITQKTGAHVTDEIWQAIRGYLSNPSIGLFRQDISPSQLKVMKRQQEIQPVTDPAVTAAMAQQELSSPTPVKKKPTNSLQIDESKVGMLTFSPARSNAAAGTATTPRGGMNSGDYTVDGGAVSSVSRNLSADFAAGGGLSRNPSTGSLGGLNRNASAGSIGGLNKNPSSGSFDFNRNPSVDLARGTPSFRGGSLDLSTPTHHAGPAPLFLSPRNDAPLSPISDDEPITGTNLEQLLVPVSPRSLDSLPTSNVANIATTQISEDNPSGQFMLIQMKGDDVDECIILSDGSLSKLLLHLQRFDDVFRKFTDFKQIPDALRDMLAIKSYAGSTIVKHIESFINDQDRTTPCRLFSEASIKPTPVDGPSFDHILHICGSVKHFKELLYEFDMHRRKFNKFKDLVDPVTAYVRLEKIEVDMKRSDAQAATNAQNAKLAPGQAQIEAIYGRGPAGYPKAPPADRKELVSSLSGPYLSLFNTVSEFRLTHGHLDAMLYEAGGLQACLGFLNGFLTARKKFQDVDSLISAIAHMSSIDKPVPEGVWPELFRFLTNPRCNLFPDQRNLFARGDTSGLQITAAQVNELLLVPNGLDGLMVRLKHMNQEGMQFKNFQALVEEMRKREFFQIQKLHGHTAIENLPGPTPDEMKAITITNPGRMAIVAYLSSRDSKLIYHVGEMRVSKEELDSLIYEGRGLEATLDHLKKLDSFRRMFGTIQELTFAVRVAHHRGYHITELDRSTLLTYLANPKCLLFSQAAVHPVAIEGSAIDDILTACDGNVTDVLVHLRQLDRVGRRFQLFSELAPAIALASHSQTHISNEDREAILSYLSSSASHLFSESDSTDHLASGPVLDSIFLDNPGRTCDEILRALRKFDALNRKFHEFPELVKALKRAFKYDSFIDEQTRQTIVGYLMGPNVHLLQSTDHSSTNARFAWSKVKGEEVDELFLTVNGNLIELLGILKQLNDLGKHYTHFGELAPQVSKIRAKALAKKQSDLQAAMSITTGATALATAPKQLQAQASGEDQVTSGADDGTTFFSLGGGQLNPLLLPGGLNSSQPQNQLLTVYHYDESQNYHAGNPPRISDEVFESIISYLTRPGLKLFSKSESGLSPNRAVADRMVWVAGGLTPLLDHFEKFNACNRYFQNFAQLLPALILSEKNKTHLLDVDQNLIIDYFNDTEVTIFKESGLIINAEAVPGETLDALVIESGGVAQLISHIRAFSHVGRKFNRMMELIQAIQATKPDFKKGTIGSGSHLSEEVLTALVAKLYPSNMPASYVPLLQPGLILTGADLDDLVTAGNGLQPTLVYLERLEATHQQFNSIGNLLEGVRRVRNGLNLYENITPEIWSSVVAWVTSPKNHMFSGVVEGVTLDGPTLDTLLSRCGGLGGLLTKLNELDGKNYQLKSFQELLTVIPPPASSPQPISAVPNALPTHISAQVQQPPAIQTPTVISQPVPAAVDQESKYDSPMSPFMTPNPDIHAVELTDNIKQQFIAYFSQPQKQTLFPHISFLGGGNLLVQLGVSDYDLKTAIYNSGGSLGSLISHLDIFVSVARVFNNWGELLAAIQDVKTTHSHVPEETRVALLEFLSSDSCHLFAGLGSQSELQVEADDIDNVIASSNGLQRALNHLKTFDACGRQFKTFAELIMAITIAVQKGTHVINQDQTTFRNYLVSISPQLFEHPLTHEQSQLSGLEFDRFFSCSNKAGFAGLQHHLQQFILAERKFNNITQLLAQLERVIGGDSYVAESSRESLIEFLSSVAEQLFDANATEAELTSTDLDALIYAGHGLQPTINHMKVYLSLHRTFMNIQDLIQAVGISFDSNCHLTENDRIQIAKELTRSDSSVLDDSLKPTAGLQGAILDQLVLSAEGHVGKLINTLQLIQQQAPRVQAFDQLIELVKQHSKQVETTVTPNTNSASSSSIPPTTETAPAAPLPAISSTSDVVAPSEVTSPTTLAPIDVPTIASTLSNEAPTVTSTSSA